MAYVSMRQCPFNENGKKNNLDVHVAEYIQRKKWKRVTYVLTKQYMPYLF